MLGPDVDACKGSRVDIINNYGCEEEYSKSYLFQHFSLEHGHMMSLCKYACMYFPMAP